MRFARRLDQAVRAAWLIALRREGENVDAMRFLRLGTRYAAGSALVAPGALDSLVGTSRPYFSSRRAT